MRLYLYNVLTLLLFVHTYVVVMKYTYIALLQL